MSYHVKKKPAAHRPAHRRAMARPAVLTATLSCLLLGIVVGIYVYSLVSASRSAAEPEPVGADIGGQAPPRIAALLPFAADQLLEMGVTPVAVPEVRGQIPETWDGIPRIAIDHAAGPNIEQLIAIEPDIIITSAVYAQFIPAFETEVGARVISMDVESIEDISRHIATLGELSQQEQASHSLSTHIQGVLASVPADHGASPKTLAIFGTPHAFYAFLPDSYLGDLIECSGGQLITSDMRSHPVFKGLAPVSMEAIIDRDPELLIVVFHGPEDSARAMLERDPLWSKISAVQNNRVAFLQDDLYAMRPGSELARAINEISAIVQTEPAPAP